MTVKLAWDYRGVFSMLTASADGETVSLAMMGDFNLEHLADKVAETEREASRLLNLILSTKDTNDRP